MFGIGAQVRVTPFARLLDRLGFEPWRVGKRRLKTDFHTRFRTRLVA
jgi:hypothetical protein